MTAVMPATLTFAVLGELEPAGGRIDRVHAVMGVGDGGRAILRPLDRPVRLPPAAPVPAGTHANGVAAAGGQLQLDLGELGVCWLWSGGTTWRTWALPSVPALLRHLPPASAVGELAGRLAG